MKKDLFAEEKFTPIRGLIWRYEKRSLIELTLKCAKNCEFCYRKWKKDLDKNFCLSKKEIDEIIGFIGKNKKINEIIVSGGDPLVVPDNLIYTIEKLKELKQIEIIRVHTRVPVVAPQLVSKKLLGCFSNIKKQILYVSIHINSNKEITKDFKKAIEKIRKTGAILYSQSVFLKNVNDSADELIKLFTNLLKIGVRPYNIYRCNLIEGNEKFIIPFEKEVEIMTEVRKKISGLACPTFIVDASETAYKIPVPLDFWKTDKSCFWDYEGNKVTRF